MSESKIETSTYSATAIERRSSPILFESLKSDEVFHSPRNSRNCEIISRTQNGKEDCYSTSATNYQRRNSDITDNALTNCGEAFQRSSSSNALDQVTNQQYQRTISVEGNQYDLNPEHIRRQNTDRVTYRQDVAIRYLQPPTPPPSGPVIIREIRAPQPLELPPLVIRQRPPVPVTPPPIIVRERPPVPPPVEPSRIVNKYLPAPPPPPRRVIIERQAPLPQKPQPIIIEKWLPYKAPPERRVVVERAQPLVLRPTQKNTIITWDAPHVNLVKNIRDLGTVRVDPQTYTAQYGSQLTSSEYVLNTMARFGIGNNYAQMIQMQTSPRISTTTMNNHLQAIDSNFNSQQSLSYGERSASSIYESHNGDHCNYIEKHIEETILPDGHRRQRSSVSGSNEQEVLRQIEIYN